MARRNVEEHGLADRIALIEGDLFAPVKDARYDLILANPPYVDAATIAEFPPEYAAEPEIAHAGGADGLDIVRRILNEAPAHLTPGGTLVVRGRARPRAYRARFPASAVCLARHRGDVRRGAALARERFWRRAPSAERPCRARRTGWRSARPGFLARGRIFKSRKDFQIQRATEIRSPARNPNRRFASADPVLFQWLVADSRGISGGNSKAVDFQE